MTCEISWSSPEEEPLFKPKKQPKQWLKFGCLDTQPKVHGECLITPEKIGFKLGKISVDDSPEVLPDSEESPIIGMLKLNDSPLLKESSISASPIIGKKRKRRHKTCKIVEAATAKSEIKRKLPPTFEQKFKIFEINTRKNLKIDLQLSPDVFSEASLNIETTKSPNKTQYVISQVNSQNSSLIIESATITPQSKASLDSLYYQLPEKKKKRFKRGGLASQAQKHLKSERANVAIWKHENYLSKTGEYSISPVEEHLILTLKIEKLWVEFQTTYALCVNSNCDEFIVLINSEYVDVNKLEIASFYQIYPPYSQHTLFFNKKDVKCYINVTRLKKSGAVI